MSGSPDTFQAQLVQQYGERAGDDPLLKSKAKAWDHFQTLGLPTPRSEVFRYVPLHTLFANAYSRSTPTKVTAAQLQPYLLPECHGATLVFVNGHYQPELSDTRQLPAKVVVSSLSDATRTYSALLTNQWTRSLKEESDPFAILNAALHRQGVFLYVPPKTVVEKPVQLLHVIDTREQRMLMFPRVHLFVGTQSQLTVLNSTATLSGTGYCLNHVLDCQLEEDAYVRYLQLTQETAAEAWHFDATRATLKRNSVFKTISFTEGSATVRHDYRVQLTGEHSEAALNGLWMLADKRESHTHVLIDHQAPHCRSMQLYKGALTDYSRSSFEGKILVRQAAQKTDAFQLNNNLLLSDRANADSKPNLEIFADDVKASHGATVGQLDREQLLYMLTRGLDDKTAKNMLVYGFCKEVIDLIPIASLQAALTERAKSYLAHQRASS